jgi:hypothetical protein
MIVEAGFFTLLFLAAKKAFKKSKLDPESETIFLEALANLKGPEAPKLFKELANGFDKEGFHIQAKILRRRAAFLERTPAEKAEHTAIIARAMRSVNSDAIEVIATEFEMMTATGIARDLRKHAKDVREGTYKPEETSKQTSTNGHTVTQEVKQN